MIPFHPLADIFPLIEGEEFDQLVADVREHGIREQIVLLDGKILDGRNRYRAGVIARMLPESLGELTASQLKLFRWHVPAGATEKPSDDELLAFVLSKNLHRRQLNESQRAAVAANIANMRQGERTDLNPSANLQKVAQADAARRVNVSPRLVADAVKAKHEGDPQVFKAVEQGRLPASSAAKLVSLPREEQRRIVESDDVARVARTEVAQHSRDEREAKLADAIKALPNKRYGVIYADPEWRFEPFSRETGLEKSADNHYPTSPTDAICARPVASIAAEEGCVLFLWATVPMLPDALRVMAAWGFEYRSQFVWVKDRIGTGYWCRNQHELLLIGVRGEPPAPGAGTRERSVIEAPVGEHSAKPDIVYEYIEGWYPNLPKIELNARRAREGWDAWGLEAPEQAA